MLAGLATSWRTLAMCSLGSLGDDQRLSAPKGYGHSLTPVSLADASLSKFMADQWNACSTNPLDEREREYRILSFDDLSWLDDLQEEVQVTT